MYNFAGSCDFFQATTDRRTPRQAASFLGSVLSICAKRRRFFGGLKKFQKSCTSKPKGQKSPPRGYGDLASSTTMRFSRAGRFVCLFVCWLVHGLRKLWRHCLTEDGTHTTQGSRPSRAGKRGPFCVPDANPSLGRAPGKFALQGSRGLGQPGGHLQKRREVQPYLGLLVPIWYLWLPKCPPFLTNSLTQILPFCWSQAGINLPRLVWTGITPIVGQEGGPRTSGMFYF